MQKSHDSENTNTKNIFPKKWLAYFDILGFSNLIEKSSFYSNPDIVLEVYDYALNEAKRSLPSLDEVRIEREHFSDTFIFYAIDDAPSSYTWIQSIGKNFIRHCLDSDPFIPLRGAITYGEFYTDQVKSIYFGKAFIEAYKEAELQDWIGLILTDTAWKKIREYGLESSRHQFPLTDVPIKKDATNVVIAIKRPAYSFHAESLDQAKRIEALEAEMVRQNVEGKDKIKYQNTIAHIKRIRDSNLMSNKKA